MLVLGKVLSLKIAIDGELKSYIEADIESASQHDIFHGIDAPSAPLAAPFQLFFEYSQMLSSTPNMLRR